MSIRETIQQNLILRKHLRNHRKDEITKAFLPLTKASRIGLFVDLRAPSNKNASIDFYKRIKRDGCNYKLLLFISEKRIDINLYDYEKLFPGAQVYVVCPEDHNFWDVPRKNVIFQFLSEPFDIVFRLVLNPIFDIDIILLQSRARMFAGHSHADLLFLDFGIDIPPDSNLQSLTDNLLTYIERLDQSSAKASVYQQNMLF
ncbi:MAG: hypothetical protein KAH17_09455 [Bacteroidales bacterium]|nr:hypothetical protein [Bacteroidales bacterium]